MDQKKSQDIKSLFEEAKKAFQTAQDEKHLYEFKVQYLGKKGSLSLARKEIKNCPPEEKPAWGRLFNQIQKDLDDLYEERKSELSHQYFNPHIFPIPLL